MIINGNALEILHGMAPRSVNCCITSPPYFGLRKYDGEPQIWDGDENCEHQWIEHHQKPQGGLNKSDNPPNTGGDKETQKTAIRGTGLITNFCSLCGAWRGCLGNEPTYQAYISHLMQIFAEVWRVLRQDGTCWVVIDDSYGTISGNMHENLIPQPKWPAVSEAMRFRPSKPKNMHKSLIGIPERFVIAMTDAGWVRRNTVVWFKRNVKPESCKDRFTRDFEYVYFFAKSPKYWFEQQFEKAIDDEKTFYKKQTKKPHKWKGQPLCGGHNLGNAKFNPKGRNRRTVWDIRPAQYRGAHYAVFPEALVRPMIGAGCPPGGTVLDPFCGTGTTCLVALKLGREFIGIDQSARYCEMAEKRLGLFSKT
jgi:DNA modification methylase